MAAVWQENTKQTFTIKHLKNENDVAPQRLTATMEPITSALSRRHRYKETEA